MIFIISTVVQTKGTFVHFIKSLWSFLGIAEVDEGEIKENELHLTSHTIGRLTFGSEPIVLKV